MGLEAFRFKADVGFDLEAAFDKLAASQLKVSAALEDYLKVARAYPKSIFNSLDIGSAPAGNIPLVIGRVPAGLLWEVKQVCIGFNDPFTAGQAQTQQLSDSGNQANAAAVATLPAVVGQYTYLTAVDVTASGATAASVQTLTIAGVQGGPLVYEINVPAGALVGVTFPDLNFVPPLRSSGLNTAITATLSALGVGNTNARVEAVGYSASGQVLAALLKGSANPGPASSGQLPALSEVISPAVPIPTVPPVQFGGKLQLMKGNESLYALIPSALVGAYASIWATASIVEVPDVAGAMTWL